jgi:hypothetical protein
MAGGPGYSFPGNRVRPPSECDLNPAARGCPEFCTYNPTDAACRVDPPIVDPPVVEPPDYCSVNPTDPVCGGGGVCDVNPSDPTCQPPEPVRTITAGCVVDTSRFDLYRAGSCNEGGITNTDHVIFYVGDLDTSGRDHNAFTTPGVYRAEWSGGPCATTAADGHACQFTLPSPRPWAEQQVSRSVTVYRVADNSVVGSFTVTATKVTCNPSTMPSRVCPEPL